MFLKHSIMLLALLGVLCQPVYAQTVTVGAAGDFTTLQQAIDSFRVTTSGANASNPANNVIQLLDNTTTETSRVYVSPDITRDNTSNGLVIQSVAPQGYTILLIPTAAATYETGMTTVGYFSIYNDGRAEVDGIRVLPAATATTRGIYIDDMPTLTGSEPVTILNDVWVTPNASGLPASDGYTAPADVTIGLSIANLGVGSAVTGRTMHIELSDVRCVGGGFGLQAFNQDVTVGPGCIFAYQSTAGIQVNQTLSNAGFSIEGTANNPVLIHSNSGIGLDVGTSAGSATTVNGQWFACIGNSGQGYDQSSGGIGSISNAIFALNSGAQGNFYFYSTQDTTANTLSECTFFNATAAGAPAFNLSGAGQSPWTIEGSIFAGSGSTNDDLLFNDTTDTTSTVTIRTSAITTLGSNSLSTDDADGIRDADVGRFVIEGSVIDADPIFESVNPTDLNFLYVSNGVVYTSAGIGGAVLRGGTNQLEVPVELSSFNLD